VLLPYVKQYMKITVYIILQYTYLLTIIFVQDSYIQIKLWLLFQRGLLQCDPSGTETKRLSSLGVKGLSGLRVFAIQVCPSGTDRSTGQRKNQLGYFYIKQAGFWKESKDLVFSRKTSQCSKERAHWGFVFLFY
jgi:hypothetical protein